MNEEMSEKMPEEELVKFVQEFGSKWNSYERDIYKKSNEEDEKKPKFDNADDRYNWEVNHKVTNWFNEFSELLRPLFEQYCTDKKRVYGGPESRSYGFPAKFNGIEEPVENKMEIKNKNRAEVYFKTETKFKDEYLFVLLRKNGQWKIDNYKYRRYEDTKWDNGIL
jgi:hypothetical protein